MTRVCVSSLAVSRRGPPERAVDDEDDRPIRFGRCGDPALNCLKELRVGLGPELDRREPHVVDRCECGVGAVVAITDDDQRALAAYALRQLTRELEAGGEVRRRGRRPDRPARWPARDRLHDMGGLAERDHADAIALEERDLREGLADALDLVGGQRAVDHEHDGAVLGYRRNTGEEG